MAITLSGAITGGAQTGFTSPTYTVTTDNPPANAIAKQWQVSTIGGTQAGVLAHSIANPFTGTFFRPNVLKALGGANPVTGVIDAKGRNIFKWIFRKGLLPYTGGPTLPGWIKVEFDIPAGADFADPANLRALVSFAVGAINANSAGTGDTLINGALG